MIKLMLITIILQSILHNTVLTLDHKLGIKQSLNSEWTRFKLDHSKTYKNETSEIKRRLLWQSNFEFIQKHNQEASQNKTQSYLLKINQFADMTPEEFRLKYLNRNNGSNQSFKPIRVLATNVPTRSSTGSTTKTTKSLAIFTIKAITLPKTTSTKIKTTTSPKTTTKTTSATTTKTTTSSRITTYSTKTSTPVKTQLGNFSYVDWRLKGFVGPVRDQGFCGACWAFAAIAVLEGQLYNKTGQMIQLSMQNLIDCSHNNLNKGCNGGLEYDGWKYLKDNGGLNTEATYPYTASIGTCKFNPKSSTVQVKEIGFIQPNNETALTESIAKIGPIAVGIIASCYSFMYYSSGILNDPRCITGSMDHSVTAVGFGKDNITGLEYYIVKNSWGTSWGDKGFIKIARNMNNMLKISSDASYALVV